MAGSVNKVILIGRLGADPETKAMPSGESFVKFSVATSETWKDKTSGEKQEKTEWHNVVAFGKIAEVAGKWLKKGQSVYVEGSLSTRSWEDKESGQKRYMTEVKMREMTMLSSKPAGGGSEDSGPKSGADLDDNDAGF